MSRRSRPQTTGVSLFPFLDVLVCTMGSLILLLLVATNRIRVAAVEKARQAALDAQPQNSHPEQVASPEPTRSEPPLDRSLADEWKTRVEQLTEDRDNLQAQLAQWQAKLATSQAAVARSKVRVTTTTERLREVQDEQARTQHEQARWKREIEALQSDLTEAEQRLTKAIERQANSHSQFAFLPFDGRTGTTKRPILIECLEHEVRFLPENVSVPINELKDFAPTYNPLLVASRELTHYWKAYDRLHEGETGSKADDENSSNLVAVGAKAHEPYVLLLVRPQGTTTFNIAKAMLSPLKVAHGYELITDDMEIELAEPDPNAKQICETTVAQVLAERENFLRVLARNSGPQSESFARSVAERAERLSNRSSLTPAGEPTPPLGTGSRANLSPVPANSASPRGSATEHTASSETNRTATPLATKTTGRSLNTDSLDTEFPDEERLPQAAQRRFEPDGSKPFPLANSSRKTSGGTAHEPAPVPPAKYSDSRGAASRPGADSRSTPGATSSQNLAKMKRRYQMPQPGIGIEKAIVIRVWSNRVVIGGEFEIPVESSVRTESLIDRVLIAMDRKQATWPRPDAGYHWVPTIKYEVVPGGEQVHQRLNSALFELGLASRVDYLDADPDTAIKPASSRETSRSRAAKPVEGGAR